MARKKSKKVAEEPVQDEPQEAPVQETGPVQHMKATSRRHRPRKNSTKYLRFMDEVDYVNAFTEQFIKGELPKEDIKILADVKAYLASMEGNPYNLKEGQANAFVHNDLRQLCIEGMTVDDRKVNLKAKSVGSRVTYFNPVLAQELIRDESDAEKKAAMEERYKLLKQLPSRPGYGAD